MKLYWKQLQLYTEVKSLILNKAPRDVFCIPILIPIYFQFIDRACSDVDGVSIGPVKKKKKISSRKSEGHPSIFIFAY